MLAFDVNVCYSNSMGNYMLFNREQKEKLLGEISSGRLSHAYLIEGDEGVGKTYFASFCAKAVLCQGQKKPCGVCPACVKSQQNSHPDMFYFSPDKKATLGVDVVREIKSSVYLLPNESDKKVYIIDEAQKMTVQAQNALLKFLEEPPKSAVFFIITDKKESMLPTVVSRTRLISLTPADSEDIADFLAENVKNIDGNQIAQAVRMADGSVGRAMKLASRDMSKGRKLCLEFVPVLFGGSKAEIMSFLLGSKQNREGLKEFFTMLGVALSDVMNAKYGVTKARLIDADDAVKYSKMLTDKRIAYLFDITADTTVRLWENANINLLLTAFAARL